MSNAKVGRCATCKHWVPFDKLPDIYVDSDEPDPEFPLVHKGRAHTDDVVKFRRFGLCRKADGDSGTCDPTTLAVAEDGSDYRARFRTDYTFGCVMHEVKP